jgi:flagellar hook-length control protein FliK
LKVNTNVITNITAKKLDSPKQSAKKEEFKKVLDNQEMQTKNSSNEYVDKKFNKDQSLNKLSNENQNDDALKTSVDGNMEKVLVKTEDDNNLKAKIISFIEVSIDALKKSTEMPTKELLGVDKSTDEMAQIQQLLQSLSSMLQGICDTSTTKDQEGKLGSIDLEQLIGGDKLTPGIKGMLKNNLNEIVALLEKSKGNNQASSQILDVLQKLTTEVEQVKGDLNLLKIPKFETVSVNSEDKQAKDTLLQKVIGQGTKLASEISPNTQMQNSGEFKRDNKSSGNNSFEEKFLNNLIGEDKEETKISKAVNFMNQFESVKTLDTSKVQTPNIVIDKSNLGADIIKTIKFMEINNVKDLTVKMNPKELGEITIKIIVESGIMKASISAQNKDTYNLLNQNIQDISDRLKSMDIKIQSLDINIYEDSTFFNKNSNGRNGNGEQNNSSKANMSIEEEAIDTSNTHSIEENQVNKFV